jgi:hypothetical protein
VEETESVSETRDDGEQNISQKDYIPYSQTVRLSSSRRLCPTSVLPYIRYVSVHVHMGTHFGTHFDNPQQTLES